MRSADLTTFTDRLAGDLQMAGDLFICLAGEAAGSKREWPMLPEGSLGDPSGAGHADGFPYGALRRVDRLFWLRCAPPDRGEVGSTASVLAATSRGMRSATRRMRDQLFRDVSEAQLHRSSVGSDSYIQ